MFPLPLPPPPVLQIATGNPPHAHLHPMRVLFLIPKEPAPELKEADGFSAPFRSFVAACLCKEAGGRPSSKELLQHPFIAQVGTGWIGEGLGGGGSGHVTQKWWAGSRHEDVSHMQIGKEVHAPPHLVQGGQC